MKRILLILLAVILIAGAVIIYFLSKDSKNPYVKPCDYTVSESEIPTFTEVEFDFVHVYDSEKELPVIASAMIDINNDGVDEVYVGGGANQSDGLFEFTGKGFINISDKMGLGATHPKSSVGAASFDLNEDGWTDIIVGRSDGLYFLRNDSSTFTSIKLDIELDEKSNPGAPTFGDFDHDGDADIFLATYIKKELAEGYTIFNQENYGSNSALLRNDGDLKFTNITKQLGLAYTHNTFQGMFVDVNHDTWLDLIVVYDTGEARTYKNEEGKKYTEMPNPMTGKFGYPMGLASGDFNNDGFQDFFFSNTGTTVPKFMVKGDLRDDQTLVTDWLLFKNEGNFKFKDVAKETDLADYEFSWGCIFEDFNLDGRQDLVVAENYIAFPGHKLFKLPCRFLLQTDEGKFAAVEEQAGVVNKNYAITPLSSDFNQDGYPDLFYANLDGKQRAFLSDGGNRRSIKVRFPERAAFAGARVVVDLKGGGILSDVYAIGEGLSSDMSNVLVFGMGESGEAERITIKYIDGSEEVIESPKTGVCYDAGASLKAEL